MKTRGRKTNYKVLAGLQSTMSTDDKQDDMVTHISSGDELSPLIDPANIKRESDSDINHSGKKKHDVDVRFLQYSFPLFFLVLGNNILTLKFFAD